MTTYRVVVQGDKDVMARITRFGALVLDLTAEMDDTGKYLSSFFSGEVFASRGGVLGQPWPALSDRYAAWKAKRFPGRPSLIRSGLMNRSFRYKSTKLTTSLWNEARYFNAHQEGKGVPRRVMMALDDKRERGVIKLVEDGIKRKMRQANV